MFLAAMDEAPTTTTEKGCPSFRTAGDPRVDAFFKLVRGLSHESLVHHVERLVCECDPQICADAFSLWASTRDVRGGKGERELGQWMLLALWDRFPRTVTAMVPLIPEYGSWRDVFALLALPCIPLALDKALVPVVGVAIEQLRKDSGEGCERPSLCGHRDRSQR